MQLLRTMAKKKAENKITEIEPAFDSVLICNDRKLRPFIEILIQEPENISNQNLGTLIGVFEVTDNSEDSSYIVNYLVSIIKKEYFSKSKRGPIESLESALHKANLALSKLAEHGSISWLGKLNALVAVSERNNLHLSQTGTASAFLLRSKILTDVSEGLAPSESELHPLKTFISVSSGRLEKNDKLIITTDSIFNIFSLEEIKKSSLRFSSQDFVRFLKTALGSELEKAAVLICDLHDRKETSKDKVKRSRKEVNVFSKDAFNKHSDTNKKAEEKIDQEIKMEIQEEKTDFVDEKTGHIYIKEDAYALPQNQTEIIRSAFDGSALYIKSLLSYFNKLIFRAKIIRFPKKIEENIVVVPTEKNDPAIKNAINKKFQSGSAVLAASGKKMASEATKITQKILSDKNKDLFLSILRKIFSILASAVSKMMPNFGKLKQIISRMNYQQKLYALLIIILIITVPFFAIKIKTDGDAKKALLLAEQNKPLPIPLEQDKNVVRIENTDLAYSGNNILETINLNGKLFAITGTEIIDLDKNKPSAIPQDFGAPAQITGMNDLNLIFLLNTDKKIISFSPTSDTFQPNNIVIPAEANISSIGTYLTYIYLIDSKNNQIYRYPRAEGGFGDKTNWLKDTTDISGTRDLAMNNSIFLTDGSGITKLFKGKKQDFSIEEVVTPINIDKITLGEQSGNVYILDAQNARIISLDAENKIIAQYYNPEISSATGFAVSEHAEKIYFSNENNVNSITIN